MATNSVSRIRDFLDAANLATVSAVKIAVPETADDTIPGHCVDVPSQGQACEVPHHDDLPKRLKGMYIRANIKGRNQHWGTKHFVEMVLSVAYNWWMQGNSPTCLIADLSAKKFSDTKGHGTHKGGTDADFDLVRTLPADKNYTADKQQKCAVFVSICLAAGASRVLFSDAEVVKAVNSWAAKNEISGRARTHAKHADHFHMDL